MQIVRKDANGRQHIVYCCDNCGRITEGFHTCKPNPVIEQLRAENAALKQQRDELAEAFTVLWVSQGYGERISWDALAIKQFDSLLAKIEGAGS